MEAYINLDISHTSRPTSYAFLYNQNPSPSIKFLLHGKNSLFNMDNFNELTIKISMEASGANRTFILNNSNIVFENDIEYLLWNIPNDLTSSVDTMKISIVAKVVDNQNIVFDSFKIYFFQKSNTKLDLTLRAINDFNEAYVKYLTGIKGYEYESPNGVPKLDENGVVKWKQIPYYRHKHETMNDTLYDVEQIHGFKINRETKEWMYYDSNDDFWYFVNQIYGGGFTTPNKVESYDIYGGNFLDILNIDAVSGGKFGDSIADIIDALYFNSFIDVSLSGGAYGDDIYHDIYGGIF